MLRANFRELLVLGKINSRTGKHQHASSATREALEGDIKHQFVRPHCTWHEGRRQLAAQPQGDHTSSRTFPRSPRLNRDARTSGARLLRLRQRGEHAARPLGAVGGTNTPSNLSPDDDALARQAKRDAMGNTLRDELHGGPRNDPLTLRVERGPHAHGRHAKIAHSRWQVEARTAAAAALDLLTRDVRRQAEARINAARSSGLFPGRARLHTWRDAAGYTNDKTTNHMRNWTP
jgi:hypothetical protein